MTCLDGQKFRKPCVRESPNRITEPFGGAAAAAAAAFEAAARDASSAAAREAALLLSIQRSTVPVRSTLRYCPRSLSAGSFPPRTLSRPRQQDPVRPHFPPQAAASHRPLPSAFPRCGRRRPTAAGSKMRRPARTVSVSLSVRSPVYSSGYKPNIVYTRPPDFSSSAVFFGSVQGRFFMLHFKASG